MKRSTKLFLVVSGVTLIGVLLASCLPHYEQGGDRVLLNTDIVFQNIDGSVLANEPVYILETVGNSRLVTDIRKTDTIGRIHLDSHHCLPLTAAVAGGGFVFGQADIKDKFVVRVDPNKSHSLEKGYGKMDEADRDYAEKHGDCG